MTNQNEETMVAKTYDIKSVIKKLGIIPMEETYDVRLFMDQDRHPHIILSDKVHTDEAQLHRLYRSLYGTGTMCVKRAKSTEEQLKDYPGGVDAITIASIFQSECYGPDDMMLMSLVTAWTDGMYVQNKINWAA